MPAETLNKMMEQLAEMTKKAEKECQAANKDGLEAASDLCENGLTPGDLEALGDCLGNCPPAMQGLLQRLAEGGLIDPNQIPSDCPGLSPEELEALAEALAEYELGDADLEDLLEACRLCLGEGDCAGGCLLAGNRPGRGGINRGPGHAKLNFDGETEEHAESSRTASSRRAGSSGTVNPSCEASDAPNRDKRRNVPSRRVPA